MQDTQVPNPPPAGSAVSDAGKASRTTSKWILLAMFWGAQALVLAPVLLLWGWQAGTVDATRGAPLGDISKLKDVLEVVFEPEAWMVYACAAAGLAILQALLLLPIHKPRPRAHRGVPLAFSVAAAGLVATALVSGLALSISHVYFIYLHNPDSSVVRVSNDTLAAVFWLGVLVCWCFATPLIWAFCSRRLRSGTSWERTLHALASRLFVGTVVELIAVIPLDVMMRRKTDCYCAAGTFWGLTLGLAAGLVVAGPVMLLPLLARRRHRWYLDHCDACGYDLSALLATSRALDRCPECGSGWKPDPASRPDRTPA